MTGVAECPAWQSGAREAERAPLPGLACAAMRAAHGGGDRRHEEVAAFAGVAGVIDGAAGLAHAQHGRVRDGELGGGPVNADATGPGDAATPAWVAAIAEWMGEAGSH